MNKIGSTKTRSFLTLSLSLAAIAALPAAAQAATATASVSCGQFRVMHNDHIGSVKFPAGPYNMVASLMTCAQVTKTFQQFLQRPAGNLPKPWKVKLLSGERRRFTKVGTKVDFQATRVSDPTPTPTPSGLTCPGTFRVLHNDRIGAMQLPAGRYTISLLSHNTPGLNCASASSDFAYFLDHDAGGALPRPWKMNASAKSFWMSPSTSDGFKVKRFGS